MNFIIIDYDISFYVVIIGFSLSLNIRGKLYFIALNCTPIYTLYPKFWNVYFTP